MVWRLSEALQALVHVFAGLGLGWCCWHFVKRVCVPAESEVPVMGARRRFTPEYRRDVATLVLDTGSTNRVWGPGLRAG